MIPLPKMQPPSNVSFAQNDVIREGICFSPLRLYMKILFFIITLFVIFSANSFSDKLIVPFDCYPKELQQKFTEYGKKLDLDGNDRTQDSWGFLKNEGSEYTIYTYQAVTKEELDMIMEIIMGKEMMEKRRAYLKREYKKHTEDTIRNLRAEGKIKEADELETELKTELEKN